MTSKLLLVFSFLFFSLTLIVNGKLTKSIFYQPNPQIYHQKDFCKSVHYRDFLAVIEPDSQGRKAEEDKIRGFRALFDACRWWFLQDAIIAKSVIIPMIDTENTEHLPLLLQDKESKRQLDLSEEFFVIVEHLYTVNPQSSHKSTDYFFQTRNPEKAVAYLLAHTKISQEALEQVRVFLEAINNHCSGTHYQDSNSVSTSIAIINRYLAHPETVGNGKVVDLAKIGSSGRETGGNWTMVIGIVLGLSAIGAIVLGILWKSKYKSLGA